MNAKLMSYNTQDFPTKFHMEAQIKELEKITSDIEMVNKLKRAGLISYTLTQVWNKQGKFRLGHYWSYKDEKSFVNCQKIINQIPRDDEDSASNNSILQADRGIVLLNVSNDD